MIKACARALWFVLATTVVFASACSGEPPNKLMPPQSACVASLGEPTNGLEEDPGVANVWHFRSDHIVEGCGSYQASLRVQLIPFGNEIHGESASEILVCNRCETDKSMRWLSQFGETKFELDGDVQRIRAGYGPDLNVGLRDQQETTLVESCVWPEHEICTPEFHAAAGVDPATFQLTPQALTLPPGRSVRIPSSNLGGHYPAVPPFFDWLPTYPESTRKTRASTSGPVKLLFWAPHLRDENDLQQERPFESACARYGYPTPRECGYFMEDTLRSTVPLLELVTETLELPLQLRDAIEAAR